MDIKAIRKELGMTQERFAEAIGISRNVIANYERGRYEPSPEIIKQIRRLLEDHCANRIPRRQGTIKPHTPPKRPKIKIDVWPYRKK